MVFVESMSALGALTEPQDLNDMVYRALDRNRHVHLGWDGCVEPRRTFEKLCSVASLYGKSRFRSSWPPPMQSRALRHARQIVAHLPGPPLRVGR